MVDTVKRKDTKTRGILIFCTLASLLRIWISWLLGNVVPESDILDSVLMVEYANIFDHFWIPTEFSLVKSMSYPVFLLLPTLCGISYNVLLSLFWIIAAIACICALRRVSSDIRILAISYLFIIWAPIAFEMWGGVRIYRNAIIAPSFFLLFALLFLMISNCMLKDAKKGKVVLTSALCGITFFFAFYIKEDGFWMIPLLVLVMAICCVLIVIRIARKQLNRSFAIALLVACFIPLAIFQVGTFEYKAINQHYFGVSEVNTRTEGELGEFLENVYRIDSEDHSKYVWAPYDAIEKAFAASSTLSSHPELKESILKTSWFGGDDGQRPILGDFLGWVLRTSLVETGLWESEAHVQEMFAQVNEELEEAFANGTLEEEDAVTLASSAGSRTPAEVVDLLDDTLVTMTSPVTFVGYRMDIRPYRDSAVRDLDEAHQYMFNQYIGYLSDYGLLRIEHAKVAAGEIFSQIDLFIYRVLAPIMLIASIIGIAWSLFAQIRRKHQFTFNQRLAAATALGLFAMAFVYSFGISWFSEFIYNDDIENAKVILTFYGIGVIPMMYLAIMFGNALLFNEIMWLRRGRSWVR